MEKKRSTAQFLEPKEEVLDIARNKSIPSIGIPKEGFGENRVSLIPQTVRTLTNQGHRIVIEENAGYQSGFFNNEYSEAGAIITQSKENVFKCDVVIKSAPPTLEEISLFSAGQILISPLYLPQLTSDYLDTLRKKRIIAIAMEYFQNFDGSFPIVRIMSEIAGIASINLASQVLSKFNNGPGVLLGSISGIAPTKIVILGAGIVAEYATKTAIGLGAEVRIFDNDVSKLMRLQDKVGRRLFTSVIDPHVLSTELASADILIGAVHSTAGRTPLWVTKEMVMSMRKGAVVIDVSIDQGGCVETSRITSVDQPTFVEYGVIHFGLPNIATLFPRTASQAISHVLLPILQKVTSESSLEALLYTYEGMRNGIYCYKGCLTNEYLANRFNMTYTSIDLLLTSFR